MESARKVKPLEYLSKKSANLCHLPTSNDTNQDVYSLVVVGAMAMVMYELFSYIEKHTTAWAHRSTNNE